MASRALFRIVTSKISAIRDWDFEIASNDAATTGLLNLLRRIEENQSRSSPALVAVHIPSCSDLEQGHILSVISRIHSVISINLTAYEGDSSIQGRWMGYMRHTAEALELPAFARLQELSHSNPGHWENAKLELRCLCTLSSQNFFPTPSHRMRSVQRS
jgi:hypothetical protein